MKEFIADNLVPLSPLIFYLSIFIVVYLETAILVAFFIPGDTLIFTAGLVVATNEDFNILITCASIAIAAFLGDQTAYQMGRKYGNDFIVKRNNEYLNRLALKAEVFYQRHGVSSMFLARFYPWFRTMIPFIAGITGMKLIRFIAANIFSALIWGFGITTLGFLANAHPLMENSSRYVATFFVVITIGLVIKNLFNRNSGKVLIESQ